MLLLEASSQSFASSSLYPVHLPTNLLPLCPAVAHYIGRQQQQQHPQTVRGTYIPRDSSSNSILRQSRDCCPLGGLVHWIVADWGCFCDSCFSLCWLWGNLILHQANDCCTPKTRGLCRPAASAHMRRLCVMQPGSITHDICNLDPSLTLSATWIQNSSSSCLVSTVRCDQSKQHFKSLRSNLAFILKFHKRFFINKRQTQYSLKATTVRCDSSSSSSRATLKTYVGQLNQFWSYGSFPFP